MLDTRCLSFKSNTIGEKLLEAVLSQILENISEIVTTLLFYKIERCHSLTNLKLIKELILWLIGHLLDRLEIHHTSLKAIAFTVWMLFMLV